MATTNVLCVFEDVGIPTIGHMEVWISEPAANGTGQTAPPFYTNLKLSTTLGAQIIYDVPQRPSGESWYVVVMVYPVRQDCKKTGAQQFRFYIPEGAPSEVTLTDAISNWSGW